jgi:ammonia channel protein AmtB
MITMSFVSIALVTVVWLAVGYSALLSSGQARQGGVDVH